MNLLVYHPYESYSNFLDISAFICLFLWMFWKKHRNCLQNLSKGVDKSDRKPGNISFQKVSLFRIFRLRLSNCFAVLKFSFVAIDGVFHSCSLHQTSMNDTFVISVACLSWMPRLKQRNYSLASNSSKSLCPNG